MERVRRSRVANRTDRRSDVRWLTTVHRRRVAQARTLALLPRTSRRPQSNRPRCSPAIRPVEFDPLGQALLTAPINAVTDLARSIIWGGVHAAEEVGAFLFAEAAENAVDKAYDAVHEGNGADQGASVSDQAGGDQAGGDRRRLIKRTRAAVTSRPMIQRRPSPTRPSRRPTDRASAKFVSGLTRVPPRCRDPRWVRLRCGGSGPGRASSATVIP